MAILEDVKTWRGREAIPVPTGRRSARSTTSTSTARAASEWAAVKTGLFGTSPELRPARGAPRRPARRSRLQYDKSTVKDAPKVEADGELSPEEERRLYDHYGRSGDWDESGEDRTEGMMGRDERTGRGERFEIDADRDTDDVASPTATTPRAPPARASTATR